MSKNGWKKLERLGNLCEIVSGSTPKTNIENYWNGTYCWITPAEINDESIEIDNTVRKITALAVKDTSLRLLPKGTVLLSSRAPIGKVAIAGVEMYCNQGFKNFVCSESIHNKYLFWYLKKNNAYLNSLGRGATFKEISKSIVENLEIPLPPLATQKHIADILDAADALRRKTQQIVESYDKLAQSLFLDMFGDPVRNPKGWNKVNLGTLNKISSGSTPNRSNESYFKGNIPWVKTTEVKGVTINKTEESITNDALNNSSCKLYPRGSIILAMYGQGKTRGQIGILGIDATTNQACAVLPPSKKMNFIFLFQLLKLCYKNLRELGRGGNQPNLNTQIISNYKVLSPPLDLQNQFAEKIALIEQQKELAKQSLAESENLFNALLQKAFKGELVPESQPAEQAV